MYYFNEHRQSGISYPNKEQDQLGSLLNERPPNMAIEGLLNHKISYSLIQYLDEDGHNCD